MRKILFLIIVVLLMSIVVTGCDKKEDLVCDIGSTTITITLKKGKITRYYDEIKGDSTKEEINLLNKNYLKEIKNNKDAIEALRDVIANNGGSCK